MSMNTLLAKRLPSIVDLCQRYGVERLELFGSANSADFNAKSSDFDFLVELDKNFSGSLARRWVEFDEVLATLSRRSRWLPGHAVAAISQWCQLRHLYSGDVHTLTEFGSAEGI